MGIYSRIKEQVSTREAAEHYGYKVSRTGMMCCPFHDDRTPSMKVDQNFICFGCQEKGDVIRFTAKLFGLSPYEAARKLMDDFGIHGVLERPPDVKPGAVRRAKREQTERQQFEQAISRIYGVYCDYLHLLNAWAETYAPESPDEEPHPLFVEAMHQRDYVEYLLDLLLYGSKEDKAAVVIEKGKGVNDLEKRIREFKSGDRECAAGGAAGSAAGDDRGRCPGDAGCDREGTGEEQHHQRRHDHVL